jgi:hypothetical protein
MPTAGPVNLAHEFLVVLFELREDPVVLGLLDQGHLQDLTIGPGDEVVTVGNFDNVHEVGEKV